VPTPFRCEDPEQPNGPVLVDVLIGGGTVGVRVRRVGGALAYRRLAWDEIERTETNLLLQLVDMGIEASSKHMASG